ncbi:hypothetical protein SteCoe_6236 [Stentor coeruleus]|uniref:PDEase domain-containing protein n=1 Tax=Stentor coeruleus TaxID=5963 RepID=A0A1R2CQH7_9CILI|nr:hypothetical protein SteCoe_6236 [Stentor coeruleus]
MALYVSVFALSLLSLSNNIAYYAINKDLSVLIIGLILTFLLLIFLILFFISYRIYSKNCQKFLIPTLYFLIGLCFVFEDPDVIRVFLPISDVPSYMPGLLSLIILSVTINHKVFLGPNSIFANLILGVLSFCLVVGHDDTRGRAVYLFLGLVSFFIESLRQKFAQKKRIHVVKYEDIPIDNYSDLEFEEITTKLVETADLLSGIMSKPDDLEEPIKTCLTNIKIVSHCLQKKNNIYTVKPKFVTKNMDEQDKIFIEESCFNPNMRSPTLIQNLSIKVQNEFLYGVNELMGLLKNISKDWNFNTFFFADCCNNNPIQVAGLYAFKHYNLDEIFKIPDNILKCFLKSLEETYYNNPYHNSMHATDVMCSHLFLLCNSRLYKYSSSLDIMTGIVAALGHDAGHPARNNRFLVITKHEIAIQYNDISVLEMLHTSTLFQIILKPESGIFSNLTSDQWNLARKLIIEMILATDMSKHFELLGQFRGKYKTPESFELTNNDMKIELFRLIIKAADIGHAAKSIDLHNNWCRRVVEEFYTQGDLEKKLGLSVSMYCDRETTDISKSQAGFIKNIVLPLFCAVNFVLDSDFIENFCIEQLKINENYWVQRRKSIRGSSLILKDTEYVNVLNNLAVTRSAVRKPSLPEKYLS